MIIIINYGLGNINAIMRVYQNLGIKVSFIIIYLIIVSLLLFLSISIAIRFSSRFFISINNLIIASEKIGKGNLDTKVPEMKTDKEMEILNKNFNLMIDRLRSQQEKLIINERHEAWSNLARKLAHEIKNPLTPIQLTIDRMKTKYYNQINEHENKPITRPRPPETATKSINITNSIRNHGKIEERRLNIHIYVMCLYVYICIYMYIYI